MKVSCRKLETAEKATPSKALHFFSEQSSVVQPRRVCRRLPGPERQSSLIVPRIKTFITHCSMIGDEVCAKAFYRCDPGARM